MLPGETIQSGAPTRCPTCGVDAMATLCVRRSGAGFYLGTHCDCGPYSRESGYYPSREAAQKALETGFHRGNGEEASAEARHSPGPWQVSRSNPWNIHDARGELVGAATFTRGYQASVRDVEEMAANARVMAAGPAMLTALQGLERAVMEGAPEAVRATPTILLWLEAARAAVAAARGMP